MKGRVRPARLTAETCMGAHLWTPGFRGHHCLAGWWGPAPGAQRAELGCHPRCSAFLPRVLEGRPSGEWEFPLHLALT